ncbi:fungal-specific transcription factor domain-containing protein [Mycena epipterygia]|nr:fungal-specific transcription factor domain-containing protein [Mycena epipterygia]
MLTCAFINLLVRCDSSEKPGNKCSNCINSKTQCNHLYISKDSSSSLNYKNSREHVAAILSQTTAYIPSNDPTVLYHILVDVAKYARNLEELLALSESSTLTDLLSAAQTQSSIAPEENTSTNTTRTEEENEPSNDGVFVDSTIIDPLRQLALRVPISEADENYRFYGESSSMNFVKAAMEYVDHPGGPYTFDARRAEFWIIQPWQQPIPEIAPPQAFPDGDLLNSLIDIYFQKINPIFFLLHAPSFRASVADGEHLRDHHFGAVVLALCAVASRFSDDPRVLIADGTPSSSAGWKWFSQARPLQFLSSPKAGSFRSLYKLQLICLSVVFLASTPSPRECWILVGLGIRLAQEMGANRRSRYSTGSRSEQLLLRAFWVLFAMDTLISSLFGRPTAATSEDYDVDMPLECDDEYWDQPQSFQSANKPALSDYVTSYLKLMIIFNRAQRAIYPVKRHKDCEPEVVAELDSDLNKWVESIPSHLRWDPNREGIFLDQSTSLYVTYYHVQILIHRTFIPPPGKPATSPSAFPSLAICANSARSCGHVMEVQSRKSGHVLAINALFDSAIILLLNVWGGRRARLSPSDATRAAADIKKCMDVLHLYEKRWPVAGRKYDIITEMLNRGTGNVPQPHSLQPSLKRVRDPEDDAADSAVMHSDMRAPIAPHSTESAAQQLEQLELSIQQTNHLFSLPLYTQELGLLPVYESFDFDYNFDQHHMPTGAEPGFRYSPPNGSYSDGPSDLSGYEVNDHEGEQLGSLAGYSWQDWSTYAGDADEPLF